MSFLDVVARNGYDEKKFLVVAVEPAPNFLDRQIH